MFKIQALTEDDFADLFQPIANPLNPLAAFDWGAGYGTLFETFGEEAKFIASRPPEYVWTLLDTDGELYIVSGCHFVNRLGYFVTRNPVPTMVAFEVALEVEIECSDANFSGDISDNDSYLVLYDT